MAMPADTPIPWPKRWLVSGGPALVLVFIELAFDQAGDGLYRGGRLGALGADSDRRARRRRQQH